MKTMKSIVLALAIITGSVVSAANVPTEPTNEPAERQISTMLENPKFKVENEISAYVTFTLNAENEIVVLSVKTENEQVERFVKSRLNYNKLSANLEQGKAYGVPVRIISES